MPTHTQGERELSITTPLGKDFLLLIGLRGHETISQLFSFQLELLAEVTTKIQFEKVVGQKATVEMRLPNGEKRYFDGLIRKLSQGQRDEDFVRFRAELVPKLWLLTKKVRCRIFQQMSVPDILNKVLAGLNVSYKLSAHYYPRDYCAQYRESDFDFASRLMEEEGIYYFFDHTRDDHQLVVTDAPTQHPPVSGKTNVTYDEVSGGVREDLRITSWEKTQELRSGEYTLWDHCFELPGKNLEAKEKTIGSLAVGKVNHKLNIGGNDHLEIYDYPGGYAQRFDGVTHSGGDQPQSLHDVFRDKDRTVRIRMEQEEVRGIEITGAGNCGYFSPGHRFSLERHFDAEGAYLLTRVEHEARIVGNYRSADALPFTYENHFSCIPLDLPYRPQRVTPKPVIASHQTATVVGPKGEEIFCDKYGRVKVQFHWDREGKKDGDSSCWVRVSQVWAGKGWGAFFWPRIGHEVVVVFEDGDPDQPLIIGSVYNAENMPWFELPKFNMFNGIKSSSVRGQAGKHYNGIVFVDKKDQEHLTIHSERHMVFNAEFDKTFRVGRHQGDQIPGSRIVSIGRLPGGGGSGGGGPNENLFPQPEPQSILGMNTSVVYGGNYQIAIPLNFQMALGSNLQICLNPASFVDIFKFAQLPTDAMAAALGSGFGGNMQLTMGTSANFVMGQSYDINLGPRRIVVDVHDKTAIQPVALPMGLLIFGAAILFLVGYDLIHDDDGRAVAMMGFQNVMQMLLAALMGTQNLYHQVDKETKKAVEIGYEGAETTKASESPWLSGLVEASAIVSLFQLPALLDSVGEVQLDTAKSTTMGPGQTAQSSSPLTPTGGQQ